MWSTLTLEFAAFKHYRLTTCFKSSLIMSFFASVLLKFVGQNNLLRYVSKTEFLNLEVLMPIGLNDLKKLIDLQ